MIPRRLSSALAGALLAAACGLAAAQTLKPGLWEISNKMGGNPEMDQAMAQMQKQMASMPPEQRKMMQDMMAQRGVSMGAGAGGAMVVKTCMTKEMVERSQMPVHEKGDCTNTVSNRSASGMDVKFVCTQPPSSGEGHVTLRGDSAYDMKMTMQTTHKGKSVTTTMDASGKWLGADCGNIRPPVMPAKK
ncbi:MAG: DUF3617 domain-containing protein [Ramlibacter sp.]|nr:DUF3617 domain-containing protein [Ramlibacter sp.]